MATEEEINERIEEFNFGLKKDRCSYLNIVDIGEHISVTSFATQIGLRSMIIAAMKSNPMFVDCIKEAVKIFDEFTETTITDEELNSLKGKKITFSNGDGDSLSFVIQSAKRNVEGFEFMVYGEKYRLAFTKVWLKELLTKGYCEHSYGDSIHKFSLK